MTGMNLVRYLCFLFCLSLSPVLIAEPLTTLQLEDKLAIQSRSNDKKLAKLIGNWELSERLATPRLIELEKKLPGPLSRQALIAIADVSAFLQPPTDETPKLSPPDQDTQLSMLRRTIVLTGQQLHQLPDFLVMRSTTRFEDLHVAAQSSPVVVLERQPFEIKDQFQVVVTYRDGREDVQPHDKELAKQSQRTPSGLNELGSFGPLLQVDNKPAEPSQELPSGLSELGSFGPLLQIVLSDVLHGKIAWTRWETGTSYPLAVFQYSVAQEKSNYTVNYCCKITNPSAKKPENPFFQAQLAYDGEVSIDPRSGAVMRLTVLASFDVAQPISEVRTLIEYGAVEIGGRSYICPRKSLSYTHTKRTILLRDGFCVNDSCSPSMWKDAGVIAINDSTYESYRLFRADMKILPADSANPGSLPEK
jgi:hypothetical protein